MSKKLPSITFRLCKHCKINTYFEHNPGTENAECRNCRGSWKYEENITGYFNKVPIIEHK